MKKKRKLIAFNVGVDEQAVIAAPNLKSVYEVPLLYREQKFDEMLLKKTKNTRKQKDLKEWTRMVENSKEPKNTMKIAVVGKYFNFGASVLEDAYICVLEAIKHASWAQNCDPEIQWFDVERFEDDKKIKKVEEELREFDGIIVPQGWGSRGVEGKIKCVEFARTQKIPYLGLCFGMQMAVIEFARNVAKLKGANSQEVNKQTKHPVIHIMPNQKKYLEKKQYGGTIRLGGWPCKLNQKTMLQQLYTQYAPELVSKNIVSERHRHRYEVNSKYINKLEKHGLIISGVSPDGKLVEAIELSQKDHPFFVATQYHPEYISRPLRPHPVFMGLVKAALAHQSSTIQTGTNEASLVTYKHARPNSASRKTN